MYQPASTTVNLQPGPASYPPPPKDHLIWSIVNLVCCCMPLGLIALIFSIKSRDAAQQNNSMSAAEYSRTAYALNISATVIGVLLIVIFLVVYFVILAKVANMPQPPH